MLRQVRSTRAAGPRGGVLATDWQPLDPETDAAPPPFPFTHEVGTALTLQLANLFLSPSLRRPNYPADC